MRIVFAHFYSKIPNYLVHNLRRTVLVFPMHEVYLITDKDTSRLRIPGLKILYYTPSTEWNTLEELLDHPKSFRSNFWFTSLSRFLAIAEFMKYDDQEIIHIESDVVIASDFPFDIFSKLNTNYSFPIINNDQAIASTLYINNYNSAKELSDFILSTAREYHSTTDMYVLSMLAKNYDKKFQLLPSSTGDINSLEFAKPEFLVKTKEALTLFNGIFDGADIGMYLFGHDPRNNRGLAELRGRKYKNYLNVRKLELFMDGTRDFPSVRNFENNNIYAIFSLHIHSKNNKLFQPRKMKTVIRKSVRNSKKDTKIIFSFLVFFIAIKKSIFRRLKFRFSKLASLFKSF